MHYSIEQRTTNTGATRWRVKVRLKGARPAFGTFARKTDAKRWGESTAAAIRDGRHFPRAEAKLHTLSECITRYIDKVLPRKPRTAPFQKRQLEFWRKELGHLVLADVSASNVVEARDSLIATTEARGRKRGGATANRYLAVLSHLFTVAVHEWEWLDSNPILKIRRLKETPGRRRFLTQRELTSLLAACRASSCTALHPIVVLAAASGMRRGEILGLRRSQIDLVDGVIILTDTKNGEARRVPLGGHALEIVRDWCESVSGKEDLVFPSRKKVTPIELRKPWYAALKVAGLANVCFHDLRRTAATHLHIAGSSALHIGALLGHKTDAMVRRYTQMVDENLRDKVRTMNDAIFSGESDAGPQTARTRFNDDV